MHPQRCPADTPKLLPRVRFRAARRAAATRRRLRGTFCRGCPSAARRARSRLGCRRGRSSGTGRCFPINQKYSYTNYTSDLVTTHKTSVKALVTSQISGSGDGLSASMVALSAIFMMLQFVRRQRQKLAKFGNKIAATKTGKVWEQNCNFAQSTKKKEPMMERGEGSDGSQMFIIQTSSG